jgi:RNA polymerase sigma-70 factor, ECF subfamily
MSENIAALADSARLGDMKAFENLVRAYMKKAYYLVLGLVRNHDDALDISQNAFVKAHRAIRTLNSGERFPAWFYSILRNEALNYMRKNKRSRFESLDNPACLIEIENPDDKETDRAELNRALWEAIRKLSLEMQEILVMKHFQNMDYNEISALLGIPRGSVASRLYRARTALRAKLDGLL